MNTNKMVYRDIISPGFLAVMGSCCKQGKEFCGDTVELCQFEDENIFVLLCCDGVSSCGQDWLASRTAVETFISEFANPVQNIRIRIETAIQKAHTALNNYPSMPQILATTLVMAVWEIANDKLYYVSIGDSRIYKISNQQVELLTQDDSAAEIMKKNGKTLMHEGMVAIKRPLTKTVGVSANLQFDINEIEFRMGECIVLTTDGVHNGILFPDEFLKIMNIKHPQSQLDSFLMNCSVSNKDDASLAYLFRTGQSDFIQDDLNSLINNRMDYHDKGILEIVITDYIRKCLSNSQTDEKYLLSILHYIDRFAIKLPKEELIYFLNTYTINKQNQEIISTFTDIIRRL